MCTMMKVHEVTYKHGKLRLGEISETATGNLKVIEHIFIDKKEFPIYQKIWETENSSSSKKRRLYICNRAAKKLRGKK